MTAAVTEGDRGCPEPIEPAPSTAGGMATPVDAVDPICRWPWEMYGDVGNECTRWFEGLVEFCRVMSGLDISKLCLFEFCIDTDCSLGAATPDTDVAFWAASRMLRALRAERLDDDRWRRADVGMMLPEVVKGGYGYEFARSEVKSSDEVDAVEATDAVCARSWVSSRVRRFTWRDVRLTQRLECRLSVE
jgi:hypothetical protein